MATASEKYTSTSNYTGYYTYTLSSPKAIIMLCDNYYSSPDGFAVIDVATLKFTTLGEGCYICTQQNTSNALSSGTTLTINTTYYLSSKPYSGTSYCWAPFYIASADCSTIRTPDSSVSAMTIGYFK